MSQISEQEVKTEVSEWIEKNWDPKLTVAEWWQLMPMPDSHIRCFLKKLVGEAGAER